MKRLIPIILLLVSIAQADAQNFKFGFGLQGGASYNMLLGTSDNPDLQANLKMLPAQSFGGYGGANVELRFGNLLGLTADLNYAYNRYGLSYRTYPIILEHHTLQIPTMLQLWMGVSAVFEVGFQQSIVVASKYKEQTKLEQTVSPDESVLKYYIGIIGGFKFNLGKVVYLTVRGSYSLSDCYVIDFRSYPNISAQIGVGIRFLNLRKQAF